MKDSGHNKDLASIEAGPPTFPFWKRLMRSCRMFWLLNIYPRYRFVRVGNGFYMGRGCFILPNLVSAGNYVFIGNGCYLLSKLVIGNWTMLASQVAIVGGDHVFDMPGVPAIWAGPAENKVVTIEDDVWIGHGATILHGLRIGEGSIVAAGAVVTKNVEPYSIVGGNPAKCIRMRFDPASVEQHKRALDNLRKLKGNDHV